MHLTPAQSVIYVQCTLIQNVWALGRGVKRLWLNCHDCHHEQTKIVWNPTLAMMSQTPCLPIGHHWLLLLWRHVACALIGAGQPRNEASCRHELLDAIRVCWGTRNMTLRHEIWFDLKGNKLYCWRVYADLQQHSLFTAVVQKQQQQTKLVLDVNTATFPAKWKSQGNGTGGGEAPQCLSIVSNHRMYFHFPTRL